MILKALHHPGLSCVPVSASMGSSHLPYAMQVLYLGVQLSLSIISLQVIVSNPVDTIIFSILISLDKPFLS